MITFKEIQEARAQGEDRLFRMMPTNRVRPNPHEPRRQRDADFDVRLTANLQKRGMNNALVTAPTEDEGYVALIGGNTRLRCAIAAGMELVPCQILLTEMTEVERRPLGLGDNLLRNNLSLIDVADEAEAIMALGDMTQKKLAEMLDCSDAQISSALSLTTLPPDILAMVRAKESGKVLCGSIAAKLVKLNAFPVQQMELAQQSAKKVMSREQVDREIAKLVKKRGYNRKSGEDTVEEAGKAKPTVIKVEGENTSIRVAYDASATIEEIYTLAGRVFRSAEAAKKAGDITLFGAKKS